MGKKIIVILVVILFIGIIFQTMVIVDYYSENLNLGFYKQSVDIETDYKTLDDTIINKFFSPFDIKIRNEGKTWILRQDEGPFQNLWVEAKIIIKKAVKLQFREESSVWSELCSEPGVTISLGGYFPTKYLEYMIGIENDGFETGDIDKIMIIPVEDGLKIYLKTREGILKAETADASGLFLHNNFLNLTELLSKEPFYSKNFLIDLYHIFGENVLAGYLEPDISVSQDTDVKNIPWLIIGISGDINQYIDSISVINKQERDELMNQSAMVIKEKLLNRSANVYETYFDSFNNLFFSNQFNMYEINPDGWVSYKYTPGTEGDNKGSIKDAFINAYETLNGILSLSSEQKSDLYISRVTESEDSYTFSFDYKYNSGIIVIKDENHAAVITSTATRTIDARVIPLNFDEMAEDQIDSSFKTNFTSIVGLNKINPNQIEAYNMYLGYDEFSGNMNFVSPVWIIEKESGEKEILRLPKDVE